jgi:pSer/pThr/pTyr-binding forkhead associated (FHA) protein
MTSIEITTPDGSQQFTLQTNSVIIGRLTTSDIVLPYSHISRRHAELRTHKGIWWITDLGSTNGLHINGHRVQEAPLDPGMIIELSPHVSLRVLSIPELPKTQTAKTPTPAESQPTPLAAYAPRSPYAEDETPYYPLMRPVPPESKPRATRINSSQPEAEAAPPRPSVTPHTGQTSDAATHQAATDTLDAQRQAAEVMRRRAATGAPSTVLHVCQTCGQLTAPDAVYCQNCHHSIAAECPNCRLSLLPIQNVCPRCQTPNPGSVRRSRHTTK